MAKILICSCSKDQSFRISDECVKYNNINNNLDTKFFPNNTEYITKVYNKVLTENRSIYDYIIFMHGDVNVDLNHMINHMIECTPKYDIMGLCGCSKCSLSESPLNWFTSSKKYPEHRWGFVHHGNVDVDTFYNTHNPTTEDHSVALIDGLCIIFTKKALESDMKFDEIFMFDQYDTDISLTANINYKFNVGVIVERTLYHYSEGRSILTQDFLIHEKDLRKKWNLL